jgi:hypothetical protein
MVVQPFNSNNLFVGTDIGVFSSTDEGATWFKEPGIPNVVVTDMNVTSDNYLVAATYGRGMFKAALSVVNPVASVQALSPIARHVSDPGFTLDVYGTNFASNSVVRFNGNNRMTISLSSSHLQATFLSSDLETLGSYPVTVYNPAPGGGVSNPQRFTVIPSSTGLISGYVRKSGGTAISGVSMNGLPATSVSDSSGNYSAIINYGWSGTVVPSKPGYSFIPDSVTYTNLAGNFLTNYTATPVESVTMIEDIAPKDYSLGINYPNPFNPFTTIRFGLPKRSQVALSVFNALGQNVAQLVNGDINAGYHEVTFDGSNLASGVYFYRLQAGSFVQTKKLLLLR